MKTVTISEDALAVLSECTVSRLGPSSKVELPPGQLERKLYVEVDKVLQEIGGKWTRSVKAHVFTTDDEATKQRLDGVILSGEIAPLRKNGFFPTPLEVAGPLFDMLDPRPGMMYLEPSCGDGQLIEHLLALFPATVSQEHVFAYEINPELAQKARARVPLCGIVNGDFLNLPRGLVALAGDHGQFDRIFMNPPFENRADAKHVIQAFEMLKPGGRLVSVMASSVMFRRETEYQLVRDMAEYFEELPKGSFKTSGTMVNTVLVAMQKAAK